jgi:hypothetical protein
LSTLCNYGLSSTQPTHRLIGAVFAMLITTATFAAGQSPAPVGSSPEPQTANLQTANLRLDLPNSPGYLFSSTSTSSDTATGPAISEDPSLGQTSAAPTTAVPKQKRAGHLDMVISPQEVADPMTVHEKIVGGLKDNVSLFSVAGWLGAAGWEQLWNSSPNYGTDAGAFGQRLGAATIRGISEGVFSDCLFAPLFHEDPRYYVMGKGHPFFKRLVYAGTRVLITRTDSGHSTPNFSLIAGNAAGSALTIPYYPAKNTTFGEVAETFGGSLGGSAVGFVVNEFIIDVLVDMHLKKAQQP